MKTKIEQPPILITGCARSRTSMIGGIINLCGAFGGEMSGPNRNNQKGMFENATIRNEIMKPFLRSLKVDHLGQYPLPNVKKIRIPVDWENQVSAIFLKHGYPGGPWFYKGAKMCTHWPVWDYAFPNAKWIIVRRKDSDIVTSCMRTSFMKAFRDQRKQELVGAKTEAEGWQWWVNQHKKRFEEMIMAGLNVKVVWTDRVVDGDYTQIKEAIEWCGLQWTDEIFNFVVPDMGKVKRQ